MTLYAILQTIRKVKPTETGDPQLLEWIAELDRKVWDEVISTHEGAEGTAPSRYSEADLMSKALIPFPHEDIYIKWLSAMIDFQNAEYDRYNNDMLMFQSLYQTYIDWYNRKHMPKGEEVRGVKAGRIG